MINKWEELKKFVEHELAGLENDDKKFKPEWEENFNKGSRTTLTIIQHRMENLEKEVTEKGGF